MEILQTIWTVLTTENQPLINIINIPLVFIEMTVSMLLFTTILNISATKKQKLLYVLILSIIGLTTVWTIPTPYNTFVNIVACPIVVYLLFKTNILKAILAEIIQYIFFLVFGAINMSLFIAIFNVHSNNMFTIPIFKLCFSLILYLVIYLIYLLFKYFNMNIFLLDKLKRKNTRILLINFVIGIIAIGLQSYIGTIYIDILPLYLTVLNIVILLTYFAISMYSLSRTNKLEITTQNLEEEKLYNKTLNILYDNIRCFKHDFNNIVQAIGGYITTENMDGLKEYYTDLLDDCQKANNLSVLNPELINNPAIYSILTSKYHKADELGIKINLELFLDLNTVNMKSYQLTRILGILLDNAIESSSKCAEKIVNIIIRKDSKSNRQLFLIENTYTNKDVNTDRIFEKGYTSKSEDTKSHGLGLWEVRQILNKNDNLNLFTSKDDMYFKQQLEIYC